MKILVVNDDGYSAPGIRALYQAAHDRGHDVYVCAPSVQHSAKAQSITLAEPLLVRRIPSEDRLRIAAANGTPSDCVRIAPTLFGTSFDFCLSGINRGENVGASIYYSGTVSAAREGAMLRIPSMAVSQREPGSDAGRAELARLAVTLAERLRDTDMLDYGLLNLNGPVGEPDAWKGSRLCPISAAYFKDRYDLRTNPLGREYLWLDDSGGIQTEPYEPGSDADMLSRGWITYTFIGPLSDNNARLSGLLPPDVFWERGSHEA